eukprot:161594_1
MKPKSLCLICVTIMSQLFIIAYCCRAGYSNGVPIYPLDICTPGQLYCRAGYSNGVPIYPLDICTPGQLYCRAGYSNGVPIYPSGICAAGKSSLKVSRKFVCDTNVYNGIKLQVFLNDQCLGAANYTWAVDDIDYTVCSGDPCDYLMWRKYDLRTCQSTGDYVDEPIVVNECVQTGDGSISESTQATCTNNSYRFHRYSNKNCIGVPNSTVSVIEGGCTANNPFLNSYNQYVEITYCTESRIHTASPTIIPSIQTTFYPIKNVSNDPTQIPSIQRSIQPTLVTFLVTNTENSVLNWSFLSYFMICLVFIVIILVIFLCIYHRKYKTKTQRTKIEKVFMSNPLVIVLGIGKYDNIHDSDVMYYDIPIDIDIYNLKTFFNEFNYEIYPIYNDNNNHIKLRWTEKELIHLLQEKAQYFESNINKYDGLIVIISCHGSQHSIISSDYESIEKVAVHRIFSIKHPLSRNKPRIFIFDSCSGSDERVPALNENLIDMDRTKTIRLDRIHQERATHVWKNNEVNPDYLLSVIHAANEGFESKMSKNKGSYLIREFITKNLENIRKNKSKCLGDIFDEIQFDLHQRGKQQIVATFHNKMRGIVLKKRAKTQYLTSDEQNLVELLP